MPTLTELATPTCGHRTDGQDPVLFQETIYLTSLASIDRKFTFTRPMPVRITNQYGLWHCELEECDIKDFDETKEEALFSFQQTFDHCWEQLAHKEDNKLSQNAKKVKIYLNSIIATTTELK